MAYGLKFLGSNQQVIFDTENFDGGQTLTIVSSGQISNNATFTVPSSSLVFGRVADGNDMLGNTNSSGVLTNRSGTTIEYIVAEFTSSSTSNVGGGSYGLEIFDSSGNLTFSTRKTSSTLNFQKIFDKGELVTNGASMYTGDTDGVYVSIDYMYYSDSSNYANGATFASNGLSITYKGRYFSSDPQFSADFTIPNLGTIGIVKIRS